MSEEINLSPPITWRHRVLRGFIIRVVKLFYPQVQPQQMDNLPPPNTPVIFALNHPNFVLDQLMLRICLNRPTYCLGKSTFFRQPLSRLAMEAFNILPIYRKKDDGLPFGPRGDAAERNERILAHCRKLLHQGESFTIFPEGTTHSENHLYELQTGAARIGLAAEAEADWQRGVQLVSVGLGYVDKTTFRSRVYLVFGKPILLNEYRAAYKADSRQAAQQVTNILTERLTAAVAAARQLAQTSPPTPRPHGGAILLLLLTSPLALIGVVIHLLPYYLNGVLVGQLLSDKTRLATGKMLVGIGLLPLTWLLGAIMLALTTSIIVGALFLVMSPAIAYLSLRWVEGVQTLITASTKKHEG